MQKRPINKLLFESPSVVKGEERELQRSDFLFERKLGDGAFGQVWRVKNKASSKLYAMKQVPKDKVMKMLNQFRREVFIMYELSHPHIIKLYNHFEDEKFFYLIMELADGGNLFHKLYREKCFLERNAAQYFREVVLAVEYLHSHVPAIIHRDIKPENIILDKDGRIKLTDFGWSNYYSTDNPTLRYTMCGTPEYLPPEIVNESGHNTGADIWCLGILLFEMLTGTTPFVSKGKDQMLVNIANAKAKFPLAMPPLVKELISKMIEKDPNKRISAKEIKAHAWLAENPPIRETITQECIPKLLPSLEEINKVIQPPKEKIAKIAKIGEIIMDTSSDLDLDQSINEDNNKISEESHTVNEFRKSINKFKNQIDLKIDDTIKTKKSIQDSQGEMNELTNKIKILEDKISEKKTEINSLTGTIKEILSKLSDSNIVLEKFTSIDLSQATEKVHQKNAELLTKITQSKHLKSKSDNLRTSCEKIIQEYISKEKEFLSLSSILKKTKEKLNSTSQGKKSEITELVTNADILKSQLSGNNNPIMKLGRQERLAANEITTLIKDEIQKLGIFLRLKLDKQYNQLEEKINEKEQELAEGKIYFEDMKACIMQNSRIKKDEFVRNVKRKNEAIRNNNVIKLEENEHVLKEKLNQARKNENKHYIDNIEIDKAKEIIKVI